MDNGIGKEHPYQQIRNGEAAARLALDEVLKLSDEDTKECAYNPNYVFGAWYLEFLRNRRKAMKEGHTFTRETGEVLIMGFFHPSPEEAERRERERKEEYEMRRRVLEDRVAVKRKETGCYSEDGLYERIFYKPSRTVLFRFVDGSSIMITPQGIQEITQMCLSATQTMAKKWRGSNDEEIQKIVDEARAYWAKDEIKDEDEKVVEGEMTAENARA